MPVSKLGRYALAKGYQLSPHPFKYTIFMYKKLKPNGMSNGMVSCNWHWALNKTQGGNFPSYFNLSVQISCIASQQGHCEQQGPRLPRKHFYYHPQLVLLPLPDLFVLPQGPLQDWQCHPVVQQV